MTNIKRARIDWDQRDINRAEKAIRAVNHKLRQRIIDVIEGAGKPVSVTDIYIAMRIDQSVCSQHLSILRKTGVVSAERGGKNVYYSVDHEMVARAKEAMKMF